MIVEVRPVWSDDEGEGIEYFVIRVAGTGEVFRVRDVFIDDVKLENPYEVEFYEAVYFGVIGERQDGTWDEALVHTPAYYAMWLRGER
ncbi:MAG: hypothetical protein LM576_07940 [Thermofilum sp.]|nr:hypothetical protein [Thermofilum sp.]